MRSPRPAPLGPGARAPGGQAGLAKYAVPAGLEGGHTAVIGSYVFEGLIPAEYIKRVIGEKRPMKGLSVPGMPVGAPGMPGSKTGPINVYYLDATSSPRIFATF